ncbi:restriction endonuclease subunit S [Lactobacillus delbrueckii]|uniref:restriction endonuclease subunit S n=2 Tax=Lactobacillus delbrueckii TaxID=1584 RepID=UPI001F429001|nr:restriction endonuclease subunit S [Lactobacillus delbrueckii]
MIFAWEQCKLGDVAKINSGKDYKGLQPGKIPVYGTGGYMLSVNDKLSDIDAIGIGRKGTIDKPYYLNAPFWTVDTLFYVTPRGTVDISFMFPLFKNINWKRYDESTGVPSLSKNTIKKIRVSFPQNNEQVKIGDLFQKITQIITLHEEKKRQLERLKSALLQKMFADKSGYPAVRFRRYNTAWKQAELGNLMDVGSVKRIHQSDWQDSGIRFLRARDIVAEYKHEKIDKKLYIDKNIYIKYSMLSGKVHSGDLLVTGVGTIGIPMLIKNEIPIYFKDGNIIWFKNNNTINGYFLYYSFSSKNIRNFIKASAGTGTVVTYTIENGKKTPIILPSNQVEQREIGLCFHQLDYLISLYQKKIDRLNSIKQSFLQNMFI